MRVLHVTRTFHPAIGGMEDMILNLVRHQRARGLVPEILTLDRPAGSDLGVLPAEDAVEGIPVRRIAWRGSSRYPFAPSVVQHLAETDLVHVHAIDFFYDAVALTRPFHRKALVASTHGGFFHTSFMRQAKVAWFHTLTRLSTRAYDGIAASSTTDARLFGPLRPRLLRTIVNGVNVRKWAGRGSAVPVKHLIYFGRFATHKRIDAAFALLRVLRAHDPTWRLTVAGSPADQSAAHVMAAAAAFGPAVEVVVRPSEDALAELIAAAGYFVCASDYEGFGIAAVEAMSAGLIPVLSDIAPFRTLLEPARDFLLFDPADPATAAVRLDRLHAELTPGWAAVRQRSMRVAARYGWEDVATRYDEFYAASLDRRRRR